MDEAWWRVHKDEVKQVFRGDIYSSNQIPGVKHIALNPRRNSGLAAIKVALTFGATRIVMLGYDSQHTEGKKHWHGDHPKGLGNAGSVQHWPMRFAEFARKLSPDIEIVNASKVTALRCFPLMDLNEALEWI